MISRRRTVRSRVASEENILACLARSSRLPPLPTWLCLDSDLLSLLRSRRHSVVGRCTFRIPLSSLAARDGVDPFFLTLLSQARHPYLPVHPSPPGHLSHSVQLTDVLHPSRSIALLFIPQALAPNVVAIILTRFFQGTMACIEGPVAAGVVADLFPKSSRSVGLPPPPPPPSPPEAY
jgi:hypothetical protein